MGTILTTNKQHYNDMSKYIDVSKEVRRKIANTFSVTERTVFNALNYDDERGFSQLALRIRSFAMQNGGVVMTAQPEEEVVYDSEGNLRQYFSNKAMIEIDKQSGDCTLYWDGEKMIDFEDIKVRELESLQTIARQWTPQNAGLMCEPAYRDGFKTKIMQMWNNDK